MPDSRAIQAGIAIWNRVCDDDIADAVRQSTGHERGAAQVDVGLRLSLRSKAESDPQIVNFIPEGWAMGLATMSEPDDSL